MKRETASNRRSVVGRSTLALGILAGVGFVAAGVNALASHSSVQLDRGEQIATREFPMAPGSALTIDHAAGSVRVYAWPKQSALFEFRYPDDMDLHAATLPVEFISDDEGLLVFSGTPDAWPGVGAEVHLNVFVPTTTPIRINVRNGAVYVAGVETSVSVTTGNGAVFCEQIAGPVRIETRNGDIECRHVAGAIAARTGNGSIAVDDRFTTRRMGLELVSENGPVCVTLPRDAQFEVDAEARHGRVRSYFQTDELDGLGIRRMVGTVAGGGPRLLLRALNGTVRIDRG